MTHDTRRGSVAHVDKWVCNKYIFIYYILSIQIQGHCCTNFKLNFEIWTRIPRQIHYLENMAKTNNIS